MVHGLFEESTPIERFRFFFYFYDSKQTLILILLSSSLCCANKNGNGDDNDASSDALKQHRLFNKNINWRFAVPEFLREDPLAVEDVIGDTISDDDDQAEFALLESLLQQR